MRWGKFPELILNFLPASLISQNKDVLPPAKTDRTQLYGPVLCHNAVSLSAIIVLLYARHSLAYQSYHFLWPVAAPLSYCRAPINYAGPLPEFLAHQHPLACPLCTGTSLASYLCNLRSK